MVASLVDALQDRASRVRIAALKALVLLDLSADVWQEISAWVLTGLNDPYAGGAQGADRLEIIEAATRVPVEVVRRRLGELATSGDEEEARAALSALNTLRHPAAVAPLITRLSKTDPEARQWVAADLARLNVSAAQDELRKLVRTDRDGIVRFWLAVALAGIGEPEHLDEVFAQLHKGELDIDPWSYESSYFQLLIRKFGPFPYAVESYLRRLKQTFGDGLSRMILSDLLGRRDNPLEMKDVFGKPGNDEQLALTKEENARAKSEWDLRSAENAVPELTDVWPTQYREFVSSSPAELCRLSPTQAGSLVASLFAAITRQADEQWHFIPRGNAVMHLSSCFRAGIVPDLASLFESYLSVCDVSFELNGPLSTLRWQIAWVASRSSVGSILAESARRLSEPDELTRLAAARFVEEAMRYAPEYRGPQFGGGVEPPGISGDRFEVVQIFYATDRRLSGTRLGRPNYGTERGDLEFGTCNVSIPKDHRSGELETPSIVRLEFRHDPEKHIALQTVVPLTASHFFAAVKKRIEQTDRKEILVFVHGFNVSFENGARRTAQIARDLDFAGVPVLYSWPSRGRLSRAAYRHDANNVGWTVRHLRQVLEDLAAKSGADAIHLIAHSMGNQALAAALKDIAVGMGAKTHPAFTEVVLTAPDIDADVFKEMANEFRKAARHVTLYVSAKDKALHFSKRYQGDYVRAGDTETGVLIIPGVETIDVSAVDTNFIGHFYYADNTSVLSDLYYLIRGNRPHERFGLKTSVAHEETYWTFRPVRR
jgi:esterase/lipase superfamily enzyme